MFSKRHILQHYYQRLSAWAQKRAHQISNQWFGRVGKTPFVLPTPPNVDTPRRVGTKCVPTLPNLKKS